MKRILLAILSVLVAITSGLAQCPDFTNLCGPGVTCKYGPYENPMMNTGVVEGRHTVITQQGMDPYTNYQLPMLPPGESAVVRLGNDLGGRQGESIDYAFVVDPEHPVLTIKYAFVLHPSSDYYSSDYNPQLSIYLLAPSTNPNDFPYLPFNPCNNIALNNISFFGTLQVTGSVIWRPWTTFSVDLSQYAGQQVIVRFITYDGRNDNAAFGYAYFIARCMSNRLSMVGCDGEHVTFAAPEGYVNYLWSNGSVTSTSTYSLQDNLDVSCHISSDLGIDLGANCDLTFNLDSLEELTTTNGGIWYDTVCMGDSYNGHGFNLPPQPTPGIFTFTRTVWNSSDCLSRTFYKLHLVVLQRNIYYYKTACEGEDFDQYGFHYTNLPAGIIKDSLPFMNDNGCMPAYKYLHLTVSPSLSNSGELFGDTYVCDETVNTYMLHFPGPISQYQWDIPEGVTNFTNIPGQSVLLYFTEDAPNPAVISVTGTDGCGSHTLTKTVYHTPAYHLVYEDTACTGESYDGHGLQTPLLGNPGLYYLSQNGTTANGCDSNVMVRLWVGSTPEITTLTQPEEICAGQTATIHALGQNASFNLLPEPLSIVPGDILCTDFSIVKPADWPCGKTARGVVFYVDSTGQHGWAVQLEDLIEHEGWNINADYGAMPQYSDARAAILDLNGYMNTQIIISIESENIFSYVDFSNNWYIPSAGQLRILCEEQHVVNNTLQMLGGTPLFNTTDYWYTTVTNYWSSTMKTSSRAWQVSSSGKLSDQTSASIPSAGISALPGARSICDF